MKGNKAPWETTWTRIEKELSTCDLANFRSNLSISSRLLGGPKNMEKWWDLCRDESALPEHYSDTLIGKPKRSRKLGGVKVTMNSLRHAYYIQHIRKHFSVATNKQIKILEVGAGYGGLAEQLCRQFIVERLYLLDAPVMQRLQRYYLTETGHANKLSFEEPEAESIDLIVSTNSLGEMSRSTVTKYLKLFEVVLKARTGLLYLVQRRHQGSHIVTCWNHYAFSKNWQLDIQDFAGNGNWVECFGNIKE